MSDTSALDAAMGRYAEGHDPSFAIVHDALSTRLRLFLIRLCKSRTTADDLLQETFLRLHRARGTFAVGARATPWAYAIARSVYIDHVRSRAVRKESLSDREDGETPHGKTGPEADGEATAIARQTADVVARAIEVLPPNQREAFVLLRFEGMSVADAARIVGATEGAVKLRAFHAYEAIRKALAVEGAGDVAKRGAR